jgi:hypothetical protein
MRRFVTLLLVVGMFALLLTGMSTTPALADETRPSAVSSLMTTSAADFDGLLTPTAMQDPSAGPDALLLPSGDPAFHLWLWWVWWTPFGPWVSWWFPPP